MKESQESAISQSREYAVELNLAQFSSSRSRRNRFKSVSSNDSMGEKNIINLIYISGLP